MLALQAWYWRSHLLSHSKYFGLESSILYSLHTCPCCGPLRSRKLLLVPKKGFLWGLYTRLLLFYSLFIPLTTSNSLFTPELHLFLQTLDFRLGVCVPFISSSERHVFLLLLFPFSVETLSHTMRWRGLHCIQSFVIRSLPMLETCRSQNPGVKVNFNLYWYTKKIQCWP